MKEVEQLTFCMTDQTDASNGASVGMGTGKKAMSAQKSMQLHMIEQKFDMYDRDGSGSIDKRELQALAARLGGPLTSSEADQWMVQLDTDGSGAIDKQEFIEFWTKRHPGAVGGATVSDLGMKFTELDKKMSQIALTGTASSLQTHLEELQENMDKVTVAIMREEEKRAKWQKQAGEIADELGGKNRIITALKKEQERVTAALTSIEDAYLDIVRGAQVLVGVAEKHMKPIDDIARDAKAGSPRRKKEEDDNYIG